MEPRKEYTIVQVSEAAGIHANTIRHRLKTDYYFGSYDYIDENGISKKFTITKNDITNLSTDGKRKKIRLSQNFYDAVVEKERTKKNIRKYNANSPDNEEKFLNYFGNELLKLSKALNDSDKNKFSDGEIMERITPLLITLDEQLAEVESEIDDLKYTYSLANMSKESSDGSENDFSRIISIEQKNNLIDQAQECVNEWKMGKFNTVSRKDKQ